MPRSSARCTQAIAPARRCGSLKVSQEPKPISETCKSLVPSLRYFIGDSAPAPLRCRAGILAQSPRLRTLSERGSDFARRPRRAHPSYRDAVLAHPGGEHDHAEQAVLDGDAAALARQAPHLALREHGTDLLPALAHPGADDGGRQPARHGDREPLLAVDVETGWQQPPRERLQEDLAFLRRGTQAVGDAPECELDDARVEEWRPHFERGEHAGAVH